MIVDMIKAYIFYFILIVAILKNKTKKSKNLKKSLKIQKK